MSFALLCSGQGGQHPAMWQMVEGNPRAEEVLSLGAAALGVHPREWLEEPERLFDNRVAQPLLCLGALATWSALRERVGVPAAIAGYSVGELASHACAGSLGPRELADLARQRAALMDGAASRPGGLVAWSGLDRNQVTALCNGQPAWIAIANGEDTFVIGGETSVLAGLSSTAQAKGGHVTSLTVGVAAHTPLLRAAVVLFEQALEQSLWRAPSVPLLAGIDAAWVTERKAAIAHLAQQVATTIEWARCLDTLFERGCRVFVELGPGSALASMVRRHFADQVEARSVDDFRSLDAVAAWIGRRVS